MTHEGQPVEGDAVDVDSSLVRAFVAVAEAGHVGRAAQALSISQQGVSKRIARLERDLGVVLFDRSAHGMTLSADGARLLPYALDALAALDAVAAAVEIPDLRVDVMDEHAAAVGFVRRALATGVAVGVESVARGSRTSAERALLDGEVDVALGRACADPWPAALRRRHVWWEPIGLLVGRAHPLADRSEVTMADLAGLTLRFPLVGAPQDWVGFLDALTSTFGLDVDRAGCSLTFADFLEVAAGSADTATFFGLDMALPPDPRLRVVPVVAPTPVFGWAVMWRGRRAHPFVDALAASTSRRTPPARSWAPEVDRGWSGD